MSRPQHKLLRTTTPRTDNLTDITCSYNSSSLWSIRQRTSTPDPCIFEANGCFPNSEVPSEGGYTGIYGFPCVSDYYPLSQLLQFKGSVVAVGTPNSDRVSVYYSAIAARETYHYLDKIQCQFWFRPTTFNVKVSTADRTISVEPLEETTDPDPRAMAKSKVMNEINVVSMVESTFFVSTVGEALYNNVRNKMSRDGRNVTDQSTPTGTNVTDKFTPTGNQTLLGVADSFTAMADEILASFGAFSLLWPGGTQQSQVTMTIAGVKIGENPSIIIVMVWNVVTLVGVVILTIMSFVKKVPAFDFTEVASLATAANLGGREQGWTQVIASGLRGWQGDGGFFEESELAMKYWRPDDTRPPSLLVISRLSSRELK